MAVVWIIGLWIARFFFHTWSKIHENIGYLLALDDNFRAIYTVISEISSKLTALGALVDAQSTRYPSTGRQLFLMENQVSA